MTTAPKLAVRTGGATRLMIPATTIAVTTTVSLAARWRARALVDGLPNAAGASITKGQRTCPLVRGGASQSRSNAAWGWVAVAAQRG
jgi:hypothetical protein